MGGRGGGAPGFTLIELLVSVSILVLVILGIAQVFRSAGRAIRTSNATIEVDANARAVMRQLSADLSHIDRNGFLVIRSNWGLSPTRSQVSFLATGDFVNRTGAYDPAANPTAGEVRAHAAHVWYGFALTPEDGSNGFNRGLTDAQDNAVRMTDVATGGTDNNDSRNIGTLGRHAFLLMASGAGNSPSIVDANGVAVPAHGSISRTGDLVSVGPGEAQARPSSGRTSVGALTPGQLMARVRYEKYQAMNTPAFLCMGNNNFIGDYIGSGAPLNIPGWSSPFERGGNVEGGIPAPIPASYPQSGLRLIQPYDGSDYWYEGRYYCYPFKVLNSPRDGKNADSTLNLVNGSVRMSPMLLRNVREFTVDWTDGVPNADGNLRWYGDSSGLQRNYLNNSVTMTCADWFSSTGVWPPLDFFNMSYWSGGSDDWKNSMMPALTDKTGELRGYGTIYQAPGSTYDVYSGRTEIITRDVYTAVFSFDNRARWPKALRIRMRVQVPGTERNSGVYELPTRTYTQVVWLPQ